ncbi:Inorganic phosphate transport protein [Yarrowia sp. C11]|nr:Inorganic phosphate transport protein [Yarrowia sp. E02]KAG5371600.1 Inorganic phosphate transport protein [Yarrowia sp. C11]
MVNPAISNLVIMLVMMQVSKKVPFEDPQVLMGIRILYVVAQLLVLGLYLYTRSIITKKNDLTTLKYVEPANAFGGQEEPKLVTTTIKEYDIKQVNSAIRGVFTGIAMMGFMHIYMKYTNPLLLQSIMPIKSAIEQNIVQIHVFGKPASGDLKRPFKAASMFGGAGMGGGDIKTDKKTISAAETAGAGGVKEE